VVGFILGDASTAFFLAKVDSSNLKLIARSEREKAAIYRDIASAEGERKLIEEKAEADILLVQIEVHQKREEAEFMATLKRQMFQEILERRNVLPSSNRSTVRRLDTNS
jgi:nicotinamide mononucleotide adenylyltransferase